MAEYLSYSGKMSVQMIFIHKIYSDFMMIMSIDNIQLI